MKKINESFTKIQDFYIWANGLPEKDLNLVYKVQIDGNSSEFMGISLYPQFELVLLTPFCYYGGNNHEYGVDYPQIPPIPWKKLEVIESYEEEEALKIITKDDLAVIRDEEIYEDYEFNEEDNE